MHFDFKGIMEGAWNSIFVKEETEKIATERMEICKICPFFSVNKIKNDPDFKSIRPDEYCTTCGCNLHMKTRSLSQTCPDKPPRWEAVVTQQEEWEIDGKIHQEEQQKKIRKINLNKR